MSGSAPISTVGAECVKSVLVDALAEALEPKGIFERSDTDSRKLEGLSTMVRVAAGESPPERVNVTEGGFSFAVDIRSGQKTGFYIDQRDNRRAVAAPGEGGCEETNTAKKENGVHKVIDHPDDVEVSHSGTGKEGQ